jgi:hypothetical protein
MPRRVACGLVVTVMLAGCDSGVPPADDARTAIERSPLEGRTLVGVSRRIRMRGRAVRRRPPADRNMRALAGRPVEHGRRTARVQAPLAHERAAIVRSAKRWLAGHDRCVGYDIAVSRLDARHARVSYEIEAPLRPHCATFNGQSLAQLEADGTWVAIAGASTDFSCDDAPAGVVRSLFGACAFYGSDEPR